MPPTGLHPFRRGAGSRWSRAQLAFWGGLATAVSVLLWLARARAQWPWFSLWVLLLLAILAVLSHPATRRTLNLSWFGVTLVTLSGVGLSNLFLVYVERHRQRSERLELRGAYLEPAADPIRVGVGEPGLDVYLESDPWALDHWSVSIEEDPDDGFRLTRAENVEMLRTRGGPPFPWPVRSRQSVIGHPLWESRPLTLEAPDGESLTLTIVSEDNQELLRWAGASARLRDPNPLLNRRLRRELRRGLPLVELAWDSLPDRATAEDLVLTETRPARRLGRLTLRPPRYRIVSRSAPDIGAGGVQLAAGDTLWVTSRASTWAFAVDRVPAVSRISAPVAIEFVRRPRPTGWALPSAEACERDVDRCAILATGPLAPPQAVFDLSGAGLDSARYALTGRLETDRDEVRVVTTDERYAFAYGVVEPIPALRLDGDGRDAGLLISVHRTNTARRGAAVLTVLGLYLMFVSALLALLGNPGLARRLRADSPTTAAAWSLLNLFLVFLGMRLALGLRVAYAAPFYDRAATTSVGLWITFAVLLVLLGRWATWTPAFWGVLRRLERPVVRVLLRGEVGTTSSAPASSPPTSTPDPGPRRRGRILAPLGLAGLVVSVAGLVWQRPGAGLGVLVAAIGAGAWLTMGVFGRYRTLPSAGRRPLDVLTSDASGRHPSRTLVLAAAAAVVLALAIQAPIVALGPVVGALVLFGTGVAMGRAPLFGDTARTAWALYVGVAAAGLGLVWVYVGFSAASVGVWGTAALLGAAVLARRTAGPGSQRRLVVAWAALLDIGRAVFSGVAWVGVLAVLAALAFLSVQTIPPFVRFALVFVLFLLAVRAGLVCRLAVDTDRRGGAITALGLLVIPVGALLVFMLFDFGLGLVFFLPLMITALLATGVQRLPRTLAAGSALLMLVVTLSAWSVLRPSVEALRDTSSAAEFSHEFERIGNPFVDLLRSTGLANPVTRATVRSLAASEPALVEDALAYSGPSEALFAAAPSLEQVWGGRAYSAAGWTGTGLAGTGALGRGVPTVVSYAENTFAVYVLSEHGALGGLTVLLVYLALLAVVGVWVVRVRGTLEGHPERLAVLALTVGGVLWLVLPAAYVAASNLGMLPLTGQNMPFLGLNSWADVVLVSGIGTGVFVALADLNGQEAIR